MFGGAANRDDRRLAALKKGRENRSRSTTHVLLHGAEHKSCARCASLKPLAEFTHDAHTGDALRSYCRACDAERYARRKGAA